MADILNYLGVGGFLLIVLSVFVEITPCKINPIQWLGDRLNKGIKDDLEDLKCDLSNLKAEIREDSASNARRRIIAFDDELRHDPSKKHTEEQFNQVMDDITEYNIYCAKHPNYKNHKAKSAIKKINDVYSECRNNNTFLV